MKTCTKCGEAKPLTEFYRHRRGLNGVGAQCKVCHLAKVNASPRIVGIATVKASRAEAHSEIVRNANMLLSNLRIHPDDRWKAKLYTENIQKFSAQLMGTTP